MKIYRLLLEKFTLLIKSTKKLQRTNYLIKKKMNKLINKFLLEDDKFVPDVHSEATWGYLYCTQNIWKIKNNTKI